MSTLTLAYLAIVICVVSNLVMRVILWAQRIRPRDAQGRYVARSKATVREWTRGMGPGAQLLFLCGMALVWLVALPVIALVYVVAWPSLRRAKAAEARQLSAADAHRWITDHEQWYAANDMPLSAQIVRELR